MSTFEDEVPVKDLKGIAGTVVKYTFEVYNENGSDVDLFGWTARGQVWTSREADRVLLANLTCVIANGNEVEVKYVPDAAYTAVYDTELVPAAGEVEYLIGGAVRIRLGLTLP